MKKGFTLIEILAVIGILGLLIILALPTVMNLYYNSVRNTFELNAKNILKAAENAYDVAKINRIQRQTTIYTYEAGEESVSGNMEMNFSGSKPENGVVTINKNGTVAFYLYNGKYCATKLSNSNEVIIEEKSFEECIVRATPESCFITDLSEANEDIQEWYYDWIESPEASDDELLYNGMIRPSELESNEVVIYSYNYADSSCPSDIIIPSIINGKTVVGIGAEFAIADPDEWTPMGITSVEIPNTVTHIGNCAFDSNLLENLSISESVLYIGAYAFYGNLLTEITIPNNVLLLSCGAFSENQLESIDIGSGLTVIDEEVFYDNSLTTVTIPDNITEIYWGAFRYNQLSSIEIPNSVTYIDGRAFGNNYILQGNATIDNEESNVTIEWNAFDNNGADGQTPITPVFLR